MVVGFHALATLPLGTEPWYQMNRTLGEPTIGTVQFEEEKIPCHSQEVNSVSSSPLPSHLLAAFPSIR
jgi:hypothetical protein